jgi:hypothetical protein
MQAEFECEDSEELLKNNSFPVQAVADQPIIIERQVLIKI